jgi:hypothetical protein
MFKRVMARIGLRGIVLAAAALGLAMVVAPAPAQAATGNVTCTTEIDSTVITGNLTVPAGAVCILVGGTVQGNVSVGAGASLELDAVTVQGNVSVGAGASFDAGGTVMKRNLSTEGANTINIVFSEVDGNSSFDATSGPLAICGGAGSACVLFNFNPGTANKFGNVSITNTSSPAGAVYAGNFVAGSLTCSGNTSVTNTVPGFGQIANIVLGQESGQCAGL